jgi:uncharacterized membrane protein YfcA
MALFGGAPEVMKPTALALNIAAALITTVRFYRAGHFSWLLSWPFLVASIPLAFIGGAITLPATLYRAVVGLVLLFAAYRMFWFREPDRTGAAGSVRGIRRDHLIVAENRQRLSGADCRPRWTE